MEIYPVSLLENSFYFTSNQYNNYMVVKKLIDAKLLDLIYKSPPWINLVKPIQIVTLHSQPAYVVRRFTELTELKKSRFRRFFESITLTVEYLAKENLFHPRLWSRHSIWVFHDQFYIPPFDPDLSIDARRCLKDAFILACGLIFEIPELTFSTLGDYLQNNKSASMLLSIYKIIFNFSGNFSEIYSELDKFKTTPSEAHINAETYLATYPAEEVVQRCVLRSLKLIDD